MSLKLNLSKIIDESTRRALEAIQDFSNKQELSNATLGFMQIILDSPVTGGRIYHNMGFIPTDILTTRSTGSYTWNYDQFTNEYLVITTTSAVHIRCLVGKL